MCAGALTVTLCALLLSQKKSIAATFPVPVLSSNLPSLIVTPPVVPLPPMVKEPIGNEIYPAALWSPQPNAVFQLVIALEVTLLAG